MTFRVPDAVADAMARLKTSDVAGATKALRDALSCGSSTNSASPRVTPVHPLADRAARRLGDVLTLLKAQHHGLSSPMPDPTRKPLQDDPRFIWRSLGAAAGSLRYKLYVPEDRSRELSLVLMLHGCTQDPDDFARGTRMNHLADEFGLVVAYPHQPRTANAQGCWNWFDPRHQSAGTGEPARLAALAQALASEFGIASNRVFAAGLSAGAAMADVLAETYPELFSRVGLHSGLPHRAAHDVMSAFAAMKGNGSGSRHSKSALGSRKIIIQGSADATVHPSNGAELFEQMRARSPGSTVVLSDGNDAGRGAARQILIDAAGETLAEHLLIDGAGHAWSGGDGTGSYVDPTGPDASREMVKFFLSN